MTGFVGFLYILVLWFVMCVRGGRRQGVLQKSLRQLTLSLHAKEAHRLHLKATKTRLLLSPRDFNTIGMPVSVMGTELEADRPKIQTVFPEFSAADNLIDELARQGAHT